VLWLGYLGLLPLLGRRRASIWMMALCLGVITYVNMSVKEWWAAGSFSNRRFDAALPILAFGIAWCFERLSRFTSRRPVVVVGALLALFPLWNFLFMEQYKQHRIPIDDTVSFTQVTGNSAAILFDKVGYPFAWPLNWWFAWRYETSPSKYDLVYGRYFFFINRVPKEVMDLGADDGGLVGEGWSRPQFRAGRWVRVIRRKRARLFVPLERTERLRLIIHAAVRPEPVEVIVEVNEQEVGRITVTPGFEDYSLRGPVEFERGVNTLVLRPQFTVPRQVLLADRVTFLRVDVDRR
jgi:hypothetical protein